MSKLVGMPMYEFTVYVLEERGLLEEYKVVAAYFQESGRYTCIKDADHAVVEAYRTDLVTRIVRTEKPVERR